MALESGEWAALAGVFVVILGVVVYNQFRARTAPMQPASEPDEDHVVDPLLSRFAVHDGDVVGETVAVEGDHLILKQAGVFKAVPVAIAELSGEEVALRGAVDWDEALEAGAAWLEQHRTGQDDAVSGELTRSEDVRSPAREAFEKRQREIEAAGGSADSEE